MSNNERISNLEEKLDKLDDRLDSIDKTLERNTISLEIHMKRTDALETYVKEQLVEKDLNPIKNHVMKVTHAINGIFWFCSIIASIAGFVIILKQLNVI
jgi:transposase